MNNGFVRLLVWFVAFGVGGLAMREGVPLLKDLISGQSAAERAISENALMSTLYEALKEYDPSEARLLEQSIQSLIDTNASLERVGDFMEQYGVSYRVSNRDAWVQAPAHYLDVMLDETVRLLEFVHENYTAYECNDYAMGGTPALSREQSIQVSNTMSPQFMTNIVEASYAGRNAPVGRAAATASDWDRLNTEYLNGVGDIEGLNIIINASINDVRFCGAILDYLKTLQSTTFPGRDRIVAAVVSEG